MKKSGFKERETGKKALLKNSIKGGAIGLIITIAVIFIFAALILTGVFSQKLSDTLILVSVILGAAASGVFCAKKQGRGVVVAGLSASAAYIVLVLLGTMLMVKKGTESAMTLRIIIAAVAGGCFGGVLKLHRKRKKSRLRRKI